MAPRPTGEVIERERERGRVFALRFRAYGRRQFVTLGGADEGWTRQKAEAELRPSSPTSNAASGRRASGEPPRRRSRRRSTSSHLRGWRLAVVS